MGHGSGHHSRQSLFLVLRHEAVEDVLWVGNLESNLLDGETGGL
jgi:hypothetical protein